MHQPGICQDWQGNRVISIPRETEDVMQREDISEDLEAGGVEGNGYFNDLSLDLGRRAVEVGVCVKVFH